MLPLTKKDIIRFTPDKYENQENAPVYLLGVPTLAGRADFRRKVQKEGLTFISDSELLDILRDGVRIAVEEPQQPEILAIIDEFEAEPTEDNGAKVKDIERQIISIYPPYADAVADRNYYFSIVPLVAVRAFLKGLENTIPYHSKNGLVTEECLELLPEDELIAAGYKILTLLAPSAEQLKNSDSPLQSTLSPEISAAAE